MTLKVNVEKSKIVVFSQGTTTSNLKFNYNGKQLEIVDEFNYLGVLGTDHLTCRGEEVSNTNLIYLLVQKRRLQSFHVTCFQKSF
jgi:hypothetical protein